MHNSMPNFSGFSVPNATATVTRQLSRAAQKMNHVCRLATQSESGKATRDLLSRLNLPEATITVTRQLSRAAQKMNNMYQIASHSSSGKATRKLLMGLNLPNATATLTTALNRAAKKMNDVCHYATQSSGGNRNSKDDPNTKSERLAALATFVLGASSMVGVWYCRNNNAQCHLETPRWDQHELKLRGTPWKSKRRKKSMAISSAVANLGISSIQQHSGLARPEVEPPPTLIVVKRDPTVGPKAPLLPSSMHLVSRAARHRLP